MIFDNHFSLSSNLQTWEKLYVILISNGHFLLSLPVTFNKNKNSFQVTQNKLVKFAWYFRLLCLNLDNIYLTTQFNYVTPDTVSGDELMNFYLHSISRIIAGTIGFLLVFDLEKTILLTNTLLQTRRNWKGMYLIYDVFKNMIIPLDQLNWLNFNSSLWHLG